MSASQDCVQGVFVGDMDAPTANSLRQCGHITTKYQAPTTGDTGKIGMKFISCVKVTADA